MLRNRLYYALKPFLPRSLRLAIRGIWARRKRARVADHWPILPGSERPPEGWSGWPEGKQFAFVLTHDVEGPEGLARVRPLAELEMRLGFRSSFNFIPEGSYRVPDELRAWLEERGFEVGVHDLHHDGKLFRSRASFSRSARQINRYLKAWRAVGFRSGFTLRNLHWQHELEVLYDASTFDTDPFEPQPDAAGTIFPFWIAAPRLESRRPEAKPESGPNIASSPGESASQAPVAGTRASPGPKERSGYVELPYTLPQDSTLFLLLRERSPEIWLRKLDWIALHGGMALVNVHPDYLCFSNEQARTNAFPVEHYQALLEHVRRRYEHLAWSVPAREVACFVSNQTAPWPKQRPLRVAMVTYSDYAGDTRVINYANVLASRGDTVEVLGLRSSPGAPETEIRNGVRVRSIHDRFDKGEQSVASHLLGTGRFFWKSLVWLTREHRRWPFDLVHVHNLPDFLVFAAALPRRRGARIILDIHDLVPEFFSSKFRRSATSLGIRALLLMERWSARFADHCIVANDLWIERYRRRTGVNGRCSVLINHVDTSVFRALPPASPGDDRPLILFPGSLHWHQGVDLAIRAFPRVLSRFPRATFHIYGDGPMKRDWMTLADELGVGDRVKFFPPVSSGRIASIMAGADLGVVPKRADSFGNEAYSTKIMEFMALGVPVVVADTRVDRFYFDDSVVRFFESGNADALAAAMVRVLEDREETRARVTRALAYARSNCWETRKHDYLTLVDSLCANGSVRRG